jgi:hypothetical protein
MGAARDRPHDRFGICDFHFGISGALKRDLSPSTDYERAGHGSLPQRWYYALVQFGPDLQVTRPLLATDHTVVFLGICAML